MIGKKPGRHFSAASSTGASKLQHLLQTQSGFCKHKQQRRRTMIGRGGDGPTNQVVVRTRRKLRRLASTEESRSDQRAPQTQSLGEPVRSPSSSRALLNILLLPLPLPRQAVKSKRQKEKEMHDRDVLLSAPNHLLLPSPRLVISLLF